MESFDDKSSQSNDTLNQNWCPICKTFTSDRAVTDTCGHEFCLDCLKQWSNEHNSCPVCRQTYHHIRSNTGANGAIIEIPVGQPIDRLLMSMNRMIQELEEMFVERLVQLRESIQSVEQSLRTLRQIIRQLENSWRANRNISASIVEPTVTTQGIQTSNERPTNSGSNGSAQNSNRNEDDSSPKSKKQKTENSSDDSPL